MIACIHSFMDGSTRSLPTTIRNQAASHLSRVDRKPYHCAAAAAADACWEPLHWPQLACMRSLVPHLPKFLTRNTMVGGEVML